MWPWCVPWEAVLPPLARLPSSDPQHLIIHKEFAMDQPIEGFTSTMSAASTPKNPEAKSGRKRVILFSLLALTVTAAGTGYSVYWKQVGSRYVTTDNAYTA